MDVLNISSEEQHYVSIVYHYEYILDKWKSEKETNGCSLQHKKKKNIFSSSDLLLQLLYYFFETFSSECSLQCNYNILVLIEWMEFNNNWIVLYKHLILIENVVHLLCELLFSCAFFSQYLLLLFWVLEEDRRKTKFNKSTSTPLRSSF